MATSPACLLWFQRDLRLEDNPAVAAALAHGGPVVPVYIWSPEEAGDWAPGAASRWWLHQSLRQLDAELRRRGSRLIVRAGASHKELTRLVHETGADTVVWSRQYELALLQRDEKLSPRLKQLGAAARVVNSSLLVEPWEVETRQGRPFQVFTPFYRRMMEIDFDEPTPPPRRLRAPVHWLDSLDLRDLKLEPTVDWAGGIRAAWQPGERGARRALDRFLQEALAAYADDRDRPHLVATSRLSPHLHFGEIGIRTVWHAVRRTAHLDTRPGLVSGSDAYLRQLVWREFAHHLLYHFPHTTDAPLKTEFARFPWDYDERTLRAWQQGQTGYPLVDAGMRELWTTGWMHNRVRLIVGSFLVKHLLHHWVEGAKWFWDTLVDADLANNTLGWQWVAGSGADAAPYFRVFNPALQGDRFDPRGDYVRRWAPELAALPDKYVHQPWKAPEAVLRAAYVELGRTYPRPIVDHQEARRRALQAFENIRRR